MADALQSTLVQAGLALAPLRAVNTPAQAVAFFRKLGYEIPPGAFGGGLTGLSAQASDLIAAVRQLTEAGGEVAVAAALANLFARVAATVTAIRQLHTEIQAGGGAGLPNIDDLPRRLTDFLLLDFLDRQRPELHATLHLLGLIEHEPAPGPGQPVRLINWNRVGQVFNDPIRIANDVYGWETDFDSNEFLARAEKVMRSASLPGGIYRQSAAVRAALGNTATNLRELRVPVLQKGFTPETYSQFGITLSPAEAQGAQKKGLALLPFLMGATEFQFEVCDRGELIFKSTADIRGVGIVIRPPLAAEGLLNLTGAFDASITILEKISRAEETILLGTSGGTRLSVQGLGIKWFVSGTREQMDLGFEAEAQKLRLVISAGEGDGFLQKVLSGVKVDAEAGVALGMTLLSGFSFRGGAKLALAVGTHLSLGPIEIDGLRFALGPASDQFTLDAGAVVKFDLGPLQAVVEDIGLRAVLQFHPGNLGPANLDMAFKPPSGVGLSLDAGGFKGGGFLMFDSEKGEYAGALELDFNGLFSVKAIGVINTKMPDGAKGFSLLIVISSEFTPIQLSFGFTLNGVGGIFGLNRGINLNALAEGIRTNAVKSILFPENVIANISRILSDIKQFFPQQPDHFVVGPMAKLGWGTPSIITVELGLLLDLPDPMFAIVGVLKALLPEEEAPILRLQVNFLGVADFNRGYVFFRADLFDSRLLAYSITGSMAFLVSWGEAQTFALSVGGFHPDFRDLPTIPALPDGFRSLARIGLSLLSDDNPRLKVESYFAVTSNTVQFGARVELYAEAGGFNVYGFLGYDVLFQFDPFRFVAKLSGGIALRRRTSTIAGVNISATLSGPTPWDARGKATLSLLFFSISVGFHVTWGDPPPAVSAATEDLLALLLREFGDTRNWRADLPPNNHLHVSLRTIDLPAATDMLVVHPAGVLTFSQRSLPLEDFVIQKFGNKKPLAEDKFRITDANSGGAPIPADFQNVREQFAPGNFLELSDSEKLSRKSFDKLPSGFKLTATSDLLTTLPVVRPVDYELSYLRNEEIVPRGPVPLFVLAYDRLVKGSAVRQSGLAQQQTRVSLNAPPQVGLPQETFAVANAADLRSQLTTSAGPVLFATQAEAYQQQQELIGQNPALAGQLQVVSHFELNVN
jgi:hypothetical protein